MQPVHIFCAALKGEITRRAWADRVCAVHPDSVWPKKHSESPKIVIKGVYLNRNLCWSKSLSEADYRIAEAINTHSADAKK